MKPDFLVVPYSLVEDKKLTHVDEKIYSLVYWTRFFKMERCTLSNNKLSNLAGCTGNTVQKSLERLKKGDYIKIIENENEREIIPLLYFRKENTDKLSTALIDQKKEDDDDGDKMVEIKKKIEGEEQIVTKEQLNKMAKEFLDYFYETINPNFHFNRKVNWSAARHFITLYGLKESKRYIDAAETAMKTHEHPPVITSPHSLKSKFRNLVESYRREEKNNIKEI